MRNIDENGNLKWSCEECGYEFFLSCFETPAWCPNCESEFVSHY